MNTNHIYTGDALAMLRTLPDASIQCIVTSPPYFGLRDYGVDGQIGLEETPQEFVAKLVAIFNEARRVLRNDGLLWVNLGDSYASAKGRYSSSAQSLRGRGSDEPMNGKRPDLKVHGWQDKQRLFIPHRFAIAMQDDGWIARDEIVWHKRSCMPESVKDRTTKAHEFIFMFAKQQRYYYDAAAVAEPAQQESAARALRAVSNTHKNLDIPGQSQQGLHKPRKSGGEFSKADSAAQIGHGGESTRKIYETRNLRSVWSLSNDPFAGAHFATFPREIPRRCILASTKPGDVVLDPFMGAGTTAVVARQLGRQYVGIELNPEYVKIAEDRLADPRNAQIDLFASQGVAA